MSRDPSSPQNSNHVPEPQAGSGSKKRIQRIWIRIPTLPLTGHMISGKELSPSPWLGLLISAAVQGGRERAALC